MKKTIALVLGIVMLLALAVPALAAPIKGKVYADYIQDAPEAVVNCRSLNVRAAPAPAMTSWASSAGTRP